MTSKHPTCPCTQKRYEYFLKRYRNKTLHLIRRCAECGKPAQNAMTQADYDVNWINTLPIIETDGTGHSVKPTLQSRADTVQPRAKTVQSRVNPVQSRADAIMKKLQRHIDNRSL